MKLLKAFNFCWRVSDATLLPFEQWPEGLSEFVEPGIQIIVIATIKCSTIRGAKCSLGCY